MIFRFTTFIKKDTEMKIAFRALAVFITTIILLNGFLFLSETKAQENKEAVATKAQEEWYDNLIFNDKSFVFEFIRAIGYSYSGGADIGECISTARRIKNGEIKSWYNEWLKTADRLYDLAEDMGRGKNVASSREAYFRASNYYRTAGFYMHSKVNIEKSLRSWRRSRESFLKAIATLPNIEVIEIPYGKTTLPGYFLKTPNSKRKKPPLLIVHTGFDGTGEELYFAVGLAAIKRGYNCLIFEGPGQGAVIRVQKIPYRRDWEKVVTPVVDYALTRKDVDKKEIALMGISMGGYFAPRAVAFEHRIKACIANGGIFDLTASFYRKFPPELIALLKTAPEEFNAEIEEVMKEDTEVRWFFDNGMFTFSAQSPADLMLKIKGYTLEDVVNNIKCQMLVINSEDDMFFSGQAQKLYQALDCPKDYILFTRRQTAQAHCQAGATAISNEIIFNWLDKIF